MVERPKSVGSWLHDLLKSYGVDTVFGIPGVHTIPMYAGLKESGIRHITPRHEQGAGFMADGYARVTGKPGVCFIITGPGMTNILTAMGQAYSESIPMLVISSTSNRSHLRQGRGYLHELPDQQAMVSGVCAFSHTLHELSDLPCVLDRAFSIFKNARPRPVHVEIPLDVWQQPAPDPIRHHTRAFASTYGPTAHDLANAADLILKSESPLLIAGGGARMAGKEIQELAEKIGMPVLMTINARGLLPPGHPLGLSVSGSFISTRKMIEQSDLVLAVGSELGPTDFDIYDRGIWPRFKHLIRIDIDAEQLYRNAAPNLALLGASKPTVQALLKALPKDVRSSPNGVTRTKNTRRAAHMELSENMLEAVRFLEEIRNFAPDARIIGDSTQPIYAGNLFFDASSTASWFNSSVGFGTLGYALPAAIGAALGDPSRPVICLIGDGGLQFTLGELGSLRECQANVTVIVWNNNAYGEIRSSMEAADIAPVGVDLFSPDFLQLAKAFGFKTHKLKDKLGIGEIVRSATNTKEPFFILVNDE